MLLILQKFDVMEYRDESKPGKRFEYLPGMIVDRNDIPFGHTAEDWIAKELAREAVPTAATTE